MRRKREAGKQQVCSCSVCGLHYRERALAEECYAWCSTHSSCKLSVARQSVEAAKKN